MGGEDFDYSIYLQHGLLGAAILEGEGFDSRIVEMVKNHIHISVSEEEARHTRIRLPHVSYEPTTIEGRILNYSDRFHSKDPKFVSFESNVDKYTTHMPSQVNKLREAASEFGIPDLQKLVRKYGHPLT